MEAMDVPEEEGEERPFVYDGERIANLLHNFLEKIENNEPSTSTAASGASSPNNKSTMLASSTSPPGERQQPVALTILTHWARTGDAEAALSRAELEKSRLAHSSAKWTLQSAMQAVKDTMTRETVVKEKLAWAKSLGDCHQKERVSARRFENGRKSFRTCAEIRTNMNVALAKAVGDFETSKAALVLWKKQTHA